MWRRPLLTCAVLAALATAPATAGAATITVTSTADAADPSPTNATCQSASGCTLRAAIQTANRGSPGADTIMVPAGRYELSIAGADAAADPAATGDLDLTAPVTITGAALASTVIDANSIDRGFDVAAGVTATMSSLAITGGNALDGASSTAGGAIRVQGALTLANARLNGNAAQDGAGVATDALTASLTLDRVEVSDNHSTQGGEGGGINERFGGTITIDHTLVSANSSDSGGGITDDGGGTIAITDSTVAGNTASYAGGIDETGGGTVTLTRSTVRSNTAKEGGGIAETGGGAVTLVDSTVRDNTVTAGGGFPDGGGIIDEGGGSVTIRNSTISGNRAPRGGGGIHEVSRATFTLVNATISGNQAGGRGGGIEVAGGGGFTLDNVTLKGNTSGSGGGELDNCSGISGCGPQPGSVSVRNTIVDGGSAACAGPMVSKGHNLDAGSSCGFAATGDLAHTGPGLGALTDNGGPTATHAAPAGSPPIDHGDNTGCPKTDQRGVTRPQPAGGACDIGAYELAVPTPTPTPTPTPAATPAPPTPATTAPRPHFADLVRLPTVRRCVSRRHFRIRIRRLHGIRVVRAVVKVNGRRVQVVRGRRLRAPVDLRGLPKGRFTVAITVRISTGQTISGKRRYHTCTKRRRPHHGPRV